VNHRFVQPSEFVEVLDFVCPHDGDPRKGDCVLQYSQSITSDVFRGMC
jgi:hypothetical protein